MACWDTGKTEMMLENFAQIVHSRDRQFGKLILRNRGIGILEPLGKSQGTVLLGLECNCNIDDKQLVDQSYTADEDDEVVADEVVDVVVVVDSMAAKLVAGFLENSHLKLKCKSLVHSVPS